MKKELVLLQMQFQYWLAEAAYWTARGAGFEDHYSDASRRAFSAMQAFEIRLNHDQD